MADSALELIRALKASSDPPSLNGPSKIQLAQDGWNNASLYMPNKAETVLEWLLTRLLKDKNKDVYVFRLFIIASSETCFLIAPQILWRMFATGNCSMIF